MPSTSEMLVVFFYWALITVFIFRIPFFGKFGIPATWVAGILLCKVMAGIAYGYLHQVNYEGGDTFAYFNDGLIVTSALQENPLKFLHLVFGITHRPPDHDIAVYAYRMSYYTDMSSYFMVRLHALMNIFTFCHYYGNVVLYNFITLIGQLFLFRFFTAFQPGIKNAVLALLFLLPSITFWCSGIHKDGISIAAIGVILYYGEKLFHLLSGSGIRYQSIELEAMNDEEAGSINKRKRKQVISAVWMLSCGIWILFVVRNYLLLLLIPGFCTFILLQYAPRYAFLKYLLLFVLFYSFVFQLKHFNANWNLPLQMAAKQQEFFQNPGGRSNIDLATLKPGINGLLGQIPTALYHCFIVPSPAGISSLWQLPAVIDNLTILLLLFAALFFANKRMYKRTKSLMLLCLFFALSVYIFTGSIVPNLGALVRYKMPGTLFLLAGCVLVLDGKKIRHLLRFRMP